MGLYATLGVQTADQQVYHPGITLIDVRQRIDDVASSRQDIEAGRSEYGDQPFTEQGACIQNNDGVPVCPAIACNPR